MALTITQQKVISLLPIVPSILSCLCSAALIRLMVRAHFRTAYRRMVFGLSIFDIINTIRICLGVFLVPSSSRRVFAIGNDTTCLILGIATNMTVPSYTYYAALSFYFLFRIRYNMTDYYFATRLEPYIHVAVLGYPIVCSIVAACLGLFDEVAFGNGCWIAPNPDIGCGRTCVTALQWVFAAIPFTATFLILLINNLLVIGFVRKTLNRSSIRELSHRHSQSMKRNVIIQASLYVLVYYLSYVWTLIIRIMGMAGRSSQDESFPFFVFKAILHPSLGIGNLLVYVRPRYVHYRKANPNISWIWALRAVVFDDSIDAMFQPSRRRRCGDGAARRRSSGAVAGGSSVMSSSFLAAPHRSFPFGVGYSAFFTRSYFFSSSWIRSHDRPEGRGLSGEDNVGSIGSTASAGAAATAIAAEQEGHAEDTIRITAADATNSIGLIDDGRTTIGLTENNNNNNNNMTYSHHHQTTSHEPADSVEAMVSEKGSSTTPPLGSYLFHPPAQQDDPAAETTLSFPLSSSSSPPQPQPIHVSSNGDDEEKNNMDCNDSSTTFHSSTVEESVQSASSHGIGKTSAGQDIQTVVATPSGLTTTTTTTTTKNSPEKGGVNPKYYIQTNSNTTRYGEDDDKNNDFNDKSSNDDDHDDKRENDDSHVLLVRSSTTTTYTTIITATGGPIIQNLRQFMEFRDPDLEGYYGYDDSHQHNDNNDAVPSSFSSWGLHDDLEATLHRNTTTNESDLESTTTIEC